MVSGIELMHIMDGSLPVAGLKLKQTDANQTKENQAQSGNSKPMAAVTPETASAAHPSPALDLQNKLNESFNPTVMSEVGPSKIPVGWALLGLGVACGVFWTVVIAALA
jgi:hypothetical protein